MPFSVFASCTQVSALLHALASMTSSQFEIKPSKPCPTLCDDDDDETSVTSILCQWKVPKQCKESTLQMSEVTFEKC